MISTERKGVRVKCPLGGPAPCFDDLCHSGGTTLCGLDPDEEVCLHGFIPETCPECDLMYGEDYEDTDDYSADFETESDF